MQNASRKHAPPCRYGSGKSDPSGPSHSRILVACCDDNQLPTKTRNFQTVRPSAVRSVLLSDPHSVPCRVPKSKLYVCSSDIRTNKRDDEVHSKRSNAIHCWQTGLGDKIVQTSLFVSAVSDWHSFYKHQTFYFTFSGLRVAI